MARQRKSLVSFDSLENRRLLSGTAGPATRPMTAITIHAIAGPSSLVVGSGSLLVTKTGTLVIKGGDAADVIVVNSSSSTGARIRIGDANAVIPSGVKRLLIEANGGNDRVDVSGFIRLSTVAGGGGDDVLVGARGTNLIGGAGNDKLVATATSDVINLPLGGQASMQYSDVRPSVLSGGAGNDTLVADGADSVAGGGGRDLFVGATTAPSGSTNQQIQDLLHGDQGLVLSGIENYYLKT